MTLMQPPLLQSLKELRLYKMKRRDLRDPRSSDETYSLELVARRVLGDELVEHGDGIDLLVR
jgi:hypothetical protein